MQQNILTYSVLFMVLCLESVSQQIPLEYDLDGLEEKASGHNFAVLSASNATVADATISNSTWVTAFGLQGFTYELIGGASGNVLVVDDATQVVPGDINTLLNFSQLPAFAVAAATGRMIQATASDGVLYVTGAGGVVIDVAESGSLLSIGDIGGYAPRDAYSIFAVGSSTASATAYTSQLHIQPGNPYVDLQLDREARSLIISATVEGIGNGVPTTIVAASDAIHWASALWKCDGDADSEEINSAIQWLKPGGGTVYLTEGAFSQSLVLGVTVNHTKLKGSGWHTVINHNGDSYCIRADNYPTSFTRPVCLEDMTLVGNSGTYTGTGIYANYNTLLVIRNMRIYDFDSHAVFSEGVGSGGILFLYNSILARSGGGATYGGILHLSNSAGYQGGVLHDLFIWDGPKSGISWYMAGNNQTVAYLNLVTYSNNGIGISIGEGRVFSGAIALNEEGQSFSTTGVVSYGLGAGMISHGGIGTAGIAGTQTAYHGNYISQNGTYGFYAGTSSPLNAVMNNTAVQGTGDNIYFQGGNQNSIHANNLLALGSNNGISFTIATWQFVNGNYIADNASSGVLDSYSSGSGSGYGDLFSDNIFKDNGGTGSSAVFYYRSGPPILHGMVQDNFIYDSAGTSPIIYVNGFYPAGAMRDLTVSGNYYRGKYGSSPYYYANAYPGLKEFREVAQMVYPCTAGVFILASSAPARLALGDRNEPDAVLTVSSDAPTNPIANDWILHSQPDLKEHVLEWRDRNPELEEIRNLRNCEISFSWKDRKEKQLGFDITRPEFPGRLKAYNSKGEVIGVNQAQLLADLYAAAEALVAETRKLKDEIAALRKER